MSRLDPRLSKAVTAHSLIVAALNVIHSLRTRGLRRTLLFGTFGNAIPILGELLAIHVLKVIRARHVPQSSKVLIVGRRRRCAYLPLLALDT